MNRLLKGFLPILGAIILFNLVSVTESQAQLTSEILARMDAHNKTLQSLRANLTRVKNNSQLGVNDVTEGTLIYATRLKKDPLVRIDWTKPSESLAVVDDKYYVWRPAQKTAYTGSTKSSSKDAKVGNALQFMGMSKVELQKAYDVKYFGEATLKNGVKTVQLRLTPKTATTYQSADLWVDPNGMPLQTRINENNGDSLTFLLTNLRKNDTIKASEFKIDTKGVKPQQV